MTSTMFRSLLVGVTFAAASSLTGAAYASTISQGSDYSYTTDVNRRAVICDQEADARTAYVEYYNGAGSKGRINDQDGSSGSCWQNSSQEPSGIQRHKTCEDINNQPDACSAFDPHF